MVPWKVESLRGNKIIKIAFGKYSDSLGAWSMRYACILMQCTDICLAHGMGSHQCGYNTMLDAKKSAYD